MRRHAVRATCPVVGEPSVVVCVGIPLVDLCGAIEGLGRLRPVAALRVNKSELVVGLGQSFVQVDGHLRAGQRAVAVILEEQPGGVSDEMPRVGLWKLRQALVEPDSLPRGVLLLKTLSGQEAHFRGGRRRGCFGNLLKTARFEPSLYLSRILRKRRGGQCKRCDRKHRVPERTADSSHMCVLSHKAFHTGRENKPRVFLKLDPPANLTCPHFHAL